VAIRDSLAIIGNGKLIQFMDISDPTSPKVAAEYNTGGLVRGLALRDSLAFICSGGNLIILNISNIFSLVQVGYISLGSPKEVVPTDSFAYVLEDPLHAPWVTIVDITDPSNPHIRSSAGVAADWPVHIAVRNRYIYVTGYNWPFLTIIDARDPDYLVHQDAWLGTSAICIRDTFMYVGVGSSLGIYSISDPIQPIFIDTAYSGVLHSLHTIDVSGNYAYASNDSGIFVYNIFDPYNAFFVSRLATISGTWLVSNDTLLHIASESGYNIVSTVNVDSMYEVGKFYTGGRPNDIAIQGNYAYVATGRPGLTILDLSNPTSPQRVGVLDFGKKSYSIAVKDSFAYIGADGFWTIDISNKQAPETTSFYPSVVFYKNFRTISEIIISDQRAYTLDTAITIYDLSNSSEPTELIKYIVPNPSFYITIHDSLLFVVSEDAGVMVLIVLNVADPLNIFETYRSAFPARGILIKDTIAYVADDYGLTVLNIPKPGFPIISSLATPGSRSIVDMAHFGKYLYMSYGTMVIVDISDPLSPKVVGRGGGNGRIEAFDKYIYLCGDVFLTIIRNELITTVSDSPLIPAENMLFQNYPNPFNASTSINFNVKEFGLTTIKIFNIVGQEIKTIFEEYILPGYYSISWNTEDLTSGVYFYQLKTKAYLGNKKGILIK